MLCVCVCVCVCGEQTDQSPAPATSTSSPAAAAAAGGKTATTPEEDEPAEAPPPPGGAGRGSSDRRPRRGAVSAEVYNEDDAANYVKTVTVSARVNFLAANLTRGSHASGLRGCRARRTCYEDATRKLRGNCRPSPVEFSRYRIVIVIMPRPCTVARS